MKDCKGNGANNTKPCNWHSVNEFKELCRGFELDGRKILSIRLCPNYNNSYRVLKG
jgi:hypothetical protein